MRTVILKTVVILFLMQIAFKTAAQKLPVIQKSNLRAPPSIKVDGRAVEWSNKFEAFNKATEVFYSVSNDDKRLYLTVQVIRREIVYKIINGGLSFTVTKGVKKTTEGGASVTYPVFNMRDKPYLNFKAAEDLAKDKTASPRQIDSLMRANNTNMDEKAKFIKVTGITGIDTLISVYNTEGIKVRSGFDDKMVYSYELGIDLKLLDLSVKDNTPFKYNIRLNKIELDYIPGVEITRKPNGEIAMMNAYDPGLARAFGAAFGASLSTTDCWGEYTLAK